MRGVWEGAMTGKSRDYGGSLIRPEATGYGTVYFVEEMLKHAGLTIQGKKALVSGSGNVAVFTIEKLLHMGAMPITASDSGGFIHDPDGITEEKLAWIRELKEVRRGRIKEYAEHFGCKYYEGMRPWDIPADLAFPSATQNEIDGEDAKNLVKNGVMAVGEGANMPTTPAGVDIFLAAKILYGPGKAANAGGVAVSGLEQSQNSMRLSWTREEVDTKLHNIMKSIHAHCVQFGQEDGFVNYVNGANIGGFVKIADSMLAFGVMSTRVRY